jgi:hypothetical protein
VGIGRWGVDTRVVRLGFDPANEPGLVLDHDHPEPGALQGV